MTPATDCLGVAVNGANEYVIDTSRVKTTYNARYEVSGAAMIGSVEGVTQLIRRSDSATYKTYTYTAKRQVSQELDPGPTRASKRWWYFGWNAKLDFGITGGALPITGSIGGSLAPISALAAEGVTTVSDRNGNILFYSDGRTIWDRNTNIMPVKPGSTNSFPNCDTSPTAFPFAPTNQGLCASNTATQAVATFPINKDYTRYVVVTNTANAFSSSNLKYGTLYFSLIDLNQPGYPNGMIIVRNASLGPVSASPYASEALNARPNSTGDGAVVYTYRASSPNAIYAFPVYSKNNGSNIDRPAPTIYNLTSNQTPICGSDANAFRTTGFGSINFNKDATRMIVYTGGANCLGNERYKHAGTLHLFDISGGDTSMKLIASWMVGAQNPADGSMGYSADFSPSGRYIYASKIYPGELYRYDISSGNSSTIKSSEQFVGWTGCTYYWWMGGFANPCSLNPDYRPKKDASGNWPYPDWLGRPGNGGGQVLRGPDGRMYVANHGANYISFVGRPDEVNLSAIDWQYGGVRTSDGTVSGLKLPDNTLSLYGLPQMVSMYSPRFIQY